MRTRFQILFLFLFLFAGTAAAQSGWWDGKKSDEGISLTGTLGLNLSRFTHAERWDEIKAGVNVGVMAEKPILNSLSAKVGLFYTLKGSKGTNDGGFGSTLVTTFNPAYLEIPILASYRYAVNDNLRLQFDFGPYFAYGLHGKDKWEYTSGMHGLKDSEGESDLFTGDNILLQRFDCGLRLGPQVIWKNKFSASLAYEFSIINISEMGGKVGIGNFMINLGYTFCTF
ncbi:MAG: porin family protein [Alloprevotella sp.]